jgi:hypothetical protein
MKTKTLMTQLAFAMLIFAIASLFLMLSGCEAGSRGLVFTPSNGGYDPTAQMLMNYGLQLQQMGQPRVYAPYQPTRTNCRWVGGQFSCYNW